MSIEDELGAPSMDVVMLLADAAQVAEGKLFVLGGGLQALGPRPQSVGIALLIHVPWDQANVPHTWKLELLSEDGLPVMHSDAPILVQGNFEAGRPAGWPPGTPLVVPLAINFSALPVQADHRYTWRLAIDEATDRRWQVSFSVRPAPPVPA